MMTRSAAGEDDPSAALQAHEGNICRVALSAQRALHNSQYLALRRVHCWCQDGRLVLEGRVPTFYLLQLAQALVCRLPGVQQVENRLQVQAASNHLDRPSRERPHEPPPRAKPRFSARGWQEALSLIESPSA
jgi:osmotically-inducible protein OsmY